MRKIKILLSAVTLSAVLTSATWAADLENIKVLDNGNIEVTTTSDLTLPKGEIISDMKVLKDLNVTLAYKDPENAKKVISSFNVEKDKWDIKKVEDLQKALLALWKTDLGKVDGKWWPLTQGALENYINDKVQIAKENDKKDTDFIKNLNPKINTALWTLSEKAGINYKNIIEWYIKLASSKPEAKQNIEDQIMNILNLIADPNIKDGFTEKWVKVRINKINEIPNILTTLQEELLFKSIFTKSTNKWIFYFFNNFF